MRVKDGPQEVDILAWMGRTALELVGQGMMGYSFDPLVDEVHDDFAEAIKAFVFASHFDIIKCMTHSTYII